MQYREHAYTRLSIFQYSIEQMRIFRFGNAGKADKR